MSGIALNGATINNSVSSNHIRYRRNEYVGNTPIITDPEGNPIGGGDPIYEWRYYNTDATIKGICKASSSNVYINGVNAVLAGDQTVENDQYSIPSGEYVSGAHNNVSGSVSAGNNRSVYINGKLVAVNGSSVTTHAGTSTSINQGSNNVNIG